MTDRRPLVNVAGITREIPGGDTVPVAAGGTGATTAAAARTGLGAAPIDSPSFTGSPLAPTFAIPGAGDTQIVNVKMARSLFSTPLGSPSGEDWNASTNPGVGPYLMQPTSVNGPGGYNYNLTLAYGNDTGSLNVTQLAIPYGLGSGSIGSLSFRGRYTGEWSAWKKLLDSANFNDYAPSLAGAGATGTWNISVSGNAATATAVVGKNSPGSPDAIAGRVVFNLASFRAASAVTGAIVFYSPNASVTVMHELEITGMVYSPPRSVKVLINGYRFTSAQLANVSRTNLGSLAVDVRMAIAPDGRTCFILGDVGTVWSYPHIAIAAGLYSAPSPDLYANWTTALVTDLTDYTQMTSAVEVNSVVKAAASVTADSATTAGNAATLTTARTIALSGAATGTATSFNGSANISIPVTALDVSHAGVSGALGVDHGGTNFTSYAAGDIIYASGATVLAKLPAAATGNVLKSGTAPSWGKVALSADVSGILPAANGGTGQSVYGVGDMLYAGTTSTLNRLASVAASNVLRSAGVGSAPAWGKLVLTTDVSGTLPAANGGTGQASYAVGDLLYASTTTALARLAGAAAGNVLRSNGAAAPAWGKVALTTDVSGALPVANGGTGATTAAAARTALGAVDKAGDTLTGNLTIAPATVNAGLTLNTPNMATGNAVIAGQDNGSLRWAIEMGTAPNKDFAVSRFNGAYIDTPLLINWTTGQVVVRAATDFNGVSINSGGNAIGTSNRAVSGSTYYNNVLGVSVEGSFGALSYQHVPGSVAQWQFQVNSQTNFTFLNTGRAQAAVAWDVVSDERTKQNFEPLANALDRIDLLEVETFERIDEPVPMAGPSLPTRYVGVRAQGMQRAMAEGVSRSPTEAMPDRLVVASDAAGVLALAAVKELKEAVVTLTARIAQLESMLAPPTLPDPAP